MEYLAYQMIMLKAFTNDVEALSTKYAVTMDDLEKEIKETEKSTLQVCYQS